MPPTQTYLYQHRFFSDYSEGKKTCSAKEKYRLCKLNCTTYYGEHNIPPEISFDDINRIVYIYHESVYNGDIRNTISPYHGSTRSHFLFNIETSRHPSIHYLRDRVYPPRFFNLIQRAAELGDETVKSLLQFIKESLIHGNKPAGSIYLKLRNLQWPLANELLRLHFAIGRLRAHLLFHPSSERNLKALVKANLSKDDAKTLIWELKQPPVETVSHWCDSDYMPISEVLCSEEQLLTKLMQRSFYQRTKEEHQSMQRICKKIGALYAHGIESNKGGLRNLANIMLEGGLRYQAYYGELGSGNFAFPQWFSGSHGPFYIILNTDSKTPQFLLFLVPLETDKTLLIEIMQKAQDKGMLSLEEKDDLNRRLMTHDEVLGMDDADFLNLLQRP